MSDNERYNGWTNRETWAVALHINNDQGWQESVLESLREAVGEVVVGDKGYEEQDVPLQPWEAGEIVRENVEQVLFGDALGEQDIPASVAGALVDIGSLWRVDWTEIGASFLSDLEEQDAYSSGRGSDEPTHNLDED